jgi:hypothetical protein
MNSDKTESQGTLLPGTSADHPINALALGGDAPPPAAPPTQAGQATETKPKRSRTKKGGEQAAAAAAAPASKPPRKSRGAGKATADKPVDANTDKTQAGPAPAPSDAVPPATSEAIAFLGNPNAKATDLFKLQPESQRFIQYHITNMQRLEVDGALTMAHLRATGPKITPAFQKVVDSMVDLRKPVVTDAGKWAAAAQSPVPVKLGKMDIPAARGEDNMRVHLIEANAHMLATMPIDDVTPKEAAELVDADLGALGGIKGAAARHQAMEAISNSSKAQLRYRAELERQAPDLAKHVAAIWAKEEQPARESKLPENTIEPGPTIMWRNLPAQATHQVLSDLDLPAATAAPQQPGSAASAASATSRLLRSLGAATQKAGTWLANRGKGNPSPVPLTKTAAPGAPAPQKSPSSPLADVMPEAVASRFLKTDKHYYFPDKTHAFTDHGQKLATRGHHPEVVRSLVEIAKARGWDSIEVKGTDAFRRKAWMEAAKSGLTVTGYKPTALDLAELSNQPAQNTVEKGLEQQRATAAAQAAPAPPAQAQTSPQAPKAEVRPPDPALAAKAKSFASDKPTFVVKQYPELAGALGMVEAAKAFAAEKLPEGSRDEFIGIARRHEMQKILTGEQSKGPKILVAPAQAKEAGEPAKAAEGVDLGKSARDRAPARER